MSRRDILRDHNPSEIELGHEQQGAGHHGDACPAVEDNSAATMADAELVDDLSGKIDAALSASHSISDSDNVNAAGDGVGGAESNASEVERVWKMSPRARRGSKTRRWRGGTRYH